ncbi:MAG: PEP/pyruvate-binding domain-containing protein [Candidatus Binatia bacterium]|nr:PEP/pyruvate-binding domain-containing protein [Candidatus Binatia bacterium]
MRFVALVVLALALALPGTATALPDEATLRVWVEEMKGAPRGPFEGLRWFCEDGTVRPARAGCSGHGGGVQHGLWNSKAKQLRDGGFKIANVFAELDGAPFVGPAPDLRTLKQLLLERFLREADDGWVMRATLTYRGALQAEDEEAGGERILAAVLADPQWARDDRWYLMRETVRLVPREIAPGDVTAQQVRADAMRIARADSGFKNLRVKIHGSPDSGDAGRVREYAASNGRGSLQGSYSQLATDIDTLYAANNAGNAVRAAAARLPGGMLRDQLIQRATGLDGADPSSRLENGADLLGVLRERAGEWRGPAARRALVEASLALEDGVYTAGNELALQAPNATRRQRLEWLWYLTSGLYGSGLISPGQAVSLRNSIVRVSRGGAPTIDKYREEVKYLGRGPEWAGRTVAFNFGEAVQHFSRLDTIANLYPQDRLRGGPMLFYGVVTDSLTNDANAGAGVEHKVFGQTVGSGLRALNPGIARGVLRVPGAAEEAGDFDSKGIYLLPETIAELPPVGGILTEGEGNSLSHVQLLARNLGIPNVVVGHEMLSRVRAKQGQRVVLAVSPGGVVELANDGPQWDPIFGQMEAGHTLVIRPDLNKLDLNTTGVVPMSSLRAADSGRVAGPKSANLGELRNAFGKAVPDGVVIPFGEFRKLLDRPIETGGPSVWDWMKKQYEMLGSTSEGPEKKRATKAFLARLRAWIENVEFSSDFQSRLRTALHKHFGADGTYGVFVRSDTNVEDLDGFTGAGLNLTVPNVVGFTNIEKAIKDVMASPFTDRAYAWRQSHMTQPEYVFPAVLIQLGFPSEKSGVMVTTDVQGNRDGWLSIAVNEGVGGAVDGQAAESLLVNPATGETRLLANATAPYRRVLNRSGGVTKVPTQGGKRVLQPNEIQALIQLSRDAPQRFPALRGDLGEPMPADIEFGFRGGKLAVLQIRPFVESKGAKESTYLKGLDARTGGPDLVGTVPLDRVH